MSGDELARGRAGTGSPSRSSLLARRPQSAASINTLKALTWLLAFALGLVAVSLTGPGSVAAQEDSPVAGACTESPEPNDSPEAASRFEAPGCLVGRLTDGDVDLIVWTVDERQSAQTWDITLRGVGGTATSVKIVPITSAPATEALVLGTTSLEVVQPADASEATEVADVLLPAGRFLIGIGRSGTADGTPPVDIGYRLDIRAGNPLPLSGDIEPNDSADTASAVRDAFAISGDLRDSRDTYRWTTSELPEGRAWDLVLSGPLTSGAQVTLLTIDGATLAFTVLDRLGKARLADLRLPAGDYVLAVDPRTTVATAYSLIATEADLSRADPEPNSLVAQATPIDPARPVVRGRLSAGDTQDWYSLAIDETLAASLLDIRLIWLHGPPREVCLSDATGNALQCRTGETGAALTGLHLRPGPITLLVRGDPSDESSYLIRIDATSAPAADFESEPNDSPGTASVVGSGAFRGRLGAADTDHLRVTTTGEPQLWQVDVTGSGINSLRWEQADETNLGGVYVTLDERSARLTDLYLIPGDHWIRIDGSEGDYVLSMTPLGPPDPDAEREPNNETINAQPLMIEGTRTGRLPTAWDADVSRFSVATVDHLLVTLTPPPGGTVRVALESGALRLVDIDSQIGRPIVYDMVLQPGDYELWLTTLAPSEEPYRLSLERLDPFMVGSDQEPNDLLSQANVLPPTRHIDGDGPADGDTDWFRLGRLPAGGDLMLRTSGSVDRVTVSDGAVDYEGVVGEGSYVIPALPGGVPLWLRVLSHGAYTVDLEPGTTGLSAATAEAPPPSVSLTLTPDQPAVAAYWPAGQRVAGTLTLTSTSAADEDLTLDWATSDPDWSIKLAETRVSLDAGASVDIPVTIRVLPDAAVDDAVRLTVRARDTAGGQVTGRIDMAAAPDAAPVAPYQAWKVQDALLGGLNVASKALGGLPVVSIDPTAEAQLYDGETPSGAGFRGLMSGTPLTLTVDLAGDVSVAVAGMIIDPLASRLSMEQVPRAIGLLLSDDGATWTEVLTGELSPRTTDQYFVLPEPVDARFARLRIDSTWGGTSGLVVLGEWKVIAQPGTLPQPMPANIGDPVRGGHVVWMSPQAGSQVLADKILTDDPTEVSYPIGVRPGDIPMFAIGFQDDRQALLTGLEWVDPVPSDPKVRLRTIDIAISTTSPVGPWQDIGTWDLGRSADDGAVQPFGFAQPTWARFIRLTGRTAKKNVYAVELPGTVRVVEAPTTDTYRSILGEWGLGSPVGPREWSEPPDLTVAADDAHGDDTAATARDLVIGTTASGRVHRDEDVDWYSFTVPDGQNSVALTVGGVPAVGVSLTLFDESGATVPMEFEAGDVGTIDYTANVESGATYHVRVQQPPFSAVFSFDTSGSVALYLPFIRQALRAYTSGVTEGAEAVTVIPFDEDPLLPDWSDDPYLLQDAVDRYVTGGSSSAETALIDASKELTGREGARAVLLMTDAITASYERGPELWAALAGIRPMVFAVQVGGDAAGAAVSRRFMQDWAAAGAGFYQYAVSHGEMDQAFSRMATWLRRPAAYSLDMATSEVELPPPPPGTLSVVAVGPDGSPAQAPASKDIAVEIILDTSGSMLDRFGGRSRIDSAKQVLTDLVTDQLPAGAPVALRVLGSRADVCGTRVAVPFGPLDADAVTRLVDKLEVDRAADTAIGAAFDAVRGDLAGATGARIVLLITDSKEIWPHPDLCGRDPLDAIRDLKRQGIDARINIVGMTVDDKKARRRMAKWAKLGGGAYFDARDRKQLDEAIRTAVSAPYQVFDQAGKLVGSGTVGGTEVKLPPGTYRVVVSSEPPVTYEGIVVEPDASVRVTLPSR